MTRIALALAIASCFSGAAFAATATAPPTVNVNVTNPVLPVEVSNADPIPVTDTDAAGRRPARFGPMSNPQGGTIQLIPAVQEGDILVVTSLHFLLDSLIGGSPLTSGKCILFVSQGTNSRTMANIQLAPASGQFLSANVVLSLPLAAGEGLRVSCFGLPIDLSQSAIVTATGYHVPAGS